MGGYFLIIDCASGGFSLIIIFELFILKEIERMNNYNELS